MAATKSIRKGNKKALNKKEIALAIAGGGCKALYGLGVGYKLRKWGLKIKEISGVSAGSAIGLMILSGREEEGIEYFEQLLKRNKSNFRPHHLLMGKRPFPHENMYRRTLRYAIDFEKIGKSRVKIFILAVKAFPRKGKLHNYWKKLLLIPKTMRAVLLDDKDKEKGLPAHRVNQIVNDWNLKEVIFTPFNDPLMLNLFNDKLKTFTTLHAHTIPTVNINKGSIEKSLARLEKLIASHENYKDFSKSFVLKDRFGAGGIDIYKIGNDPIAEIKKILLATPGISFILQPFTKFDKGYQQSKLL
jgi:hypothetical protein